MINLKKKKWIDSIEKVIFRLGSVTRMLATSSS